MIFWWQKLIFYFLSLPRYIVRICVLSPWISLDDFLVKSVEFVVFELILLLKATLKCLQSMHMRCWTKGWTCDMYCRILLNLSVSGISWTFLDFTKHNFCKVHTLKFAKLFIYIREKCHIEELSEIRCSVS